ncbi:hypothetical protein YC2023_116628 [Brassica napus]
MNCGVDPSPSSISIHCSFIVAVVPPRLRASFTKFTNSSYSRLAVRVMLFVPSSVRESKIHFPSSSRTQDPVTIITLSCSVICIRTEKTKKYS